MPSDGKQYIGVEIKARRQEAGKSLANLAADTCIRLTYLRAIEDGNLNDLPEQAFSIGFVRNYARSLGMNGEEAVNSFRDYLSLNAPAKIDVPAPSTFQHRNTPVLATAGVSLLGLAMTLTIVFYQQKIPSNSFQEEAVAATLASNVTEEVAIAEPEEPEAKPKISQEQQVIEAPVSIADDELGLTQRAMGHMTPAAHAADNYDEQVSDALSLKASEDSWFMLKTPEGEMVWRGVLRAGQSYQPHDGENLSITTSNAGGISLHFGDDEVGALGKRGGLLQNMSLASKLSNLMVKKVADKSSSLRDS